VRQVGDDYAATIQILASIKRFQGYENKHIGVLCGVLVQASFDVDWILSTSS
jgi:hypothetical protein